MTSSSRSKSVVVYLTLVMALAVAGIGVFPGTAGATGSTVQFNVLGNTNPSGWGNNGGLASVTLMVDSVEFLHSLDPGSPYPWTVATQEICNGAGFVPSGQQYDNAYTRLFFDNGGAYLDAWYQAKTVGGSCDKKGNAIFAFGTSAWASAWAPQYTAQKSGDEFRGLACVFPNGYGFSWAACSTHLTTGEGNPSQHAQLKEAADLVKSWGWTIYGYPYIMSGDFNLTSVDPDVLGWYYGYPFNWAAEADGNYPWPGGGPQATCCWGNGYIVKIDYTWFAHMIRQAGAVVAHTGYPYSDHELFMGRITF